MPGYYIHLAACGKQALKNRSFVLGVEAPDILKKHLKIFGGTEGARAKYESLRTADMPDYQEFELRVKQKERLSSTDGLHYGMSSSPDIKAFWNSLSEQQKNNPFYRGYVWHLLTDLIMYTRLNVQSKFYKAVESKFQDALNASPDSAQPVQIEEIEMRELNRLHADWDKINARIRDAYPEVVLPDEVKELGVVQFISEGELAYVEWDVIKNTLDYLRIFAPLDGNMDVLIETVMNNI